MQRHCEMLAPEYKIKQFFLIVLYIFCNLMDAPHIHRVTSAVKKVHGVIVCDCFFKWRSWRVTELHGVLQPAGERWMLISSVKNRSAIKWHRLAHFNQMSGWIGWYHAVTHPVASPDPYFTKPGYLYWRELCGLVMRIPFPWCAFSKSLYQSSLKSFFFPDWYLDGFVHIPTDIFSPSLLCFLCCSWHYLNGWV